MAHQFPAQHQAHLAQMPTQHQNIGQQRHAPMSQPQMPTVGQQRGTQGQQNLQNPFANYDPQLALFTFEKPKSIESWEDVEAEQQHVTVQDLQNDLRKFQRNKGSVKRVLNEIPSSNCRRLINELVEDQNQELMSLNRTLQWTIASVDIDWKTVNRRQRQLRRVSVILQTGPSGYEDPTVVRAASIAAKPQTIQPNHVLAAQPPGQGMAQPMRNPAHLAQPPVHGQQSGQPPRMAPPHGQAAHGQALPPPPPPGMAHGQAPPPPPPGMAHGQAPPPPPPPGMAHPPPPPPGMVPPLPPPPPAAVPGMQRPQMQSMQQHRPMPGTFPEAMPRPPMRASQPEIEVLNPQFLKSQKKPKARHEESSSESDSEEWDSETGDSGSDRFRVRHVEHGEFAHIGKPKRGRSRQSSRSKKSRHNKPQSKARSRSRSRVETHRRRRDSDFIDPPPMGKHSPMSSKDHSPLSSRQQLPPIHIHMNTPTNEKPVRANDRVRRDSDNASPPGFRKETYRSHEKTTSQPMSRDNSWDRHSGTASYVDTASVHTADDSVFSEPERRGHRSRTHSDVVSAPSNLRSRNLLPRQESFGRPHPSHIYDHDGVDHRQSKRAYAPPNDYPHDPRQREPYYDEPAFSPRPGVHRHNSIQTPQSSPFDTARYPPRLPRSNTYGPEMHEPVYAQPRYLADRPAQDSIHLDELADALEHVREQKRKPLYGRRASEWDDRYRERMDGYDGFDRRRY